MIDFLAPLQKAWSRTSGMLFQPFQAGKWFMLGFSAWLAGFLDGNASLGGHVSYRNPPWQGGTENHAFLAHLVGWGLAAWIVIFLGLCLLAVAVGLALLWLGARGQFMFLHNVLHDSAEITVPWQRYRRPANDLFRLYVGFYLATFALMAAFLLFALVFFWPDLQVQKFREFSAYWPLIGGFLGLMALWLPIMILLFFFREFGIPFMYLSDCPAWEAAKRTFVLATHHPGSCLGYLVVRILMGAAFLFLAFCAGCLTCCIGFLPYLYAVLTLPLRVFRQCFTLDCLAQFGPEWDVWKKAGQPPPIES